MKLRTLEKFIAISMIGYIIMLFVMNNTFQGTTQACRDMSKEIKEMRETPIKVEMKHITEIRETK
jgi:hypothetical protein